MIHSVTQPGALRSLASMRVATYLGLIILLYAFTVHMALPYQLAFGWGMVALFALLQAFKKSDNDFFRIVLILISVFLAFRYWEFRIRETLSYTAFFDFIAMMMLFLAETYGNAIHIMGGFVNIMPLKRDPVPVDINNPDLPTVDVYIPTYNEPEEITIATAVAAANIRYPKEKLNIYILDDGGTVAKRAHPDPEKAEEATQRYKNLRLLADYLKADFGNVYYATRLKNDHAKAGNINHAFFLHEKGYDAEMVQELTTLGETPPAPGDLVLILDCDHIPAHDILLNTVGGFMRDEKLFLVQTPHFFINPDPIEKNLGTFKTMPSENEMFYGEIQHGLDSWGGQLLLRFGCSHPQNTHGSKWRYVWRHHHRRRRKRTFHAFERAAQRVYRQADGVRSLSGNVHRLYPSA